MFLTLLESSMIMKLRSNYDDSNYNFDELIIRHNDYPGILAIKNKCTDLNSTFPFKKDKEQNIHCD